MITFPTQKHPLAYWGVCVGGPRAGTVLEHFQPEFPCSIPKSISIAVDFGYGGGVIRESYETFVYVWVEGVKIRDNLSVHFWVPRDSINDEAFAIRNIINYYVENHKKPIS